MRGQRSKIAAVPAETITNTSKSVQVALDKAGRVCVPDEMASAAGIKDEAVLVGMIDRFEIWNPTRYQQVEAMDAMLSPKAFEMME